MLACALSACGMLKAVCGVGPDRTEPAECVSTPGMILYGTSDWSQKLLRCSAHRGSRSAHLTQQHLEHAAIVSPTFRAGAHSSTDNK